MPYKTPGAIEGKPGIRTGPQRDGHAGEGGQPGAEPFLGDRSIRMCLHDIPMPAAAPRILRASTLGMCA
jgi:hypothetical protein